MQGINDVKNNRVKSDTLSPKATIAAVVLLGIGLLFGAGITGLLLTILGVA